MANAYRTYAFFSRQPGDQPHPELLRVEDHLRRRHPSLRVSEPSHADLLLVFGGDGTLLDAVRSRGARRQHIVAFNTGHAGFLTTVRESERFAETLDRAIAGTLLRSPVPVLRVIRRSGGVETNLYAVNDIVVDCTMTWLGLRLESVGLGRPAFIKDVRGSGVCACSAIGSTSPMATHLHAPRMDPGVRALYVKGIHDMSAPASGLLLPADGCVLRITLTGIEPNLGIPDAHRHPPALFLDGIRACDVAVGDVIEISYEPRPSVLLRLPEESHWDRVRAMRS